MRLLRLIVFLSLMIFPQTIPAQRLPSGSWMFAQDQWNTVEVLTVSSGEEGSRILKEFDDQGRMEYTYQIGSFATCGGEAVFTARKFFRLTESENKYIQEQGEDSTQISLGEMRTLKGNEIVLGERTYIDTLVVRDRILSEEDRLKTHFIPLINLTVFSLQARVEGFGSDGLIAYWRKAGEFTGVTGSAQVSMRSSGRILFIFPRLPVWLDIDFTGYSVFSGIKITGSQRIYSENRQGDGHLSGFLEVKDVGTVSYGSEDGENALLIKDGRIAGGNIELTIGQKSYLIDGRLR